MSRHRGSQCCVIGGRGAPGQGQDRPEAAAVGRRPGGGHTPPWPLSALQLEKVRVCQQPHNSSPYYLVSHRNTVREA